MSYTRDLNNALSTYSKMHEFRARSNNVPGVDYNRSQQAINSMMGARANQHNRMAAQIDRQQRATAPAPMPIRRQALQRLATPTPAAPANLDNRNRRSTMHSSRRSPYTGGPTYAQLPRRPSPRLGDSPPGAKPLPSTPIEKPAPSTPIEKPLPSTPIYGEENRRRQDAIRWAMKEYARRVGPGG